MMKTIKTLSFAVALLVPATAVAQEAGTLEDGSNDWTVGIAPRVGLTIPTSELGSTVAGGLEIDVALGDRFVVALDGSLVKPSMEGTVTDDRINGQGSYEIDVTELKLALDVIFRFFGPEHTVVPYVGAGPVLHMLRSTETTSFAPGENEAQDTNLGFEGLAGVDLRAGPGYLLGEIRVLGSNLNHLYTGNSNAGNVMISAGYRLVF